MDNEYRCPMLGVVIDDTICYDIQMVVGSGSLIKKSILDEYADLFSPSMVTDELAAVFCANCSFNQLFGPPTMIEHGTATELSA